MISLILTVILSYLGVLAALGLTLFVVGLLGHQEVMVPSWAAKVVRLLAWPWLQGWATAITIGYATAFLVPDPHEALRTHEATHRAQSLGVANTLNRVLPFWLALILGAAVQAVRYLIEYVRRGYVNNRFEVAARRAAGEE